MTPPVPVPSVVQPTSAAGGIFARRRLRQMGQSGSLKLNGSAQDPGPWRVNVWMPIAPGTGAATVVQVIVGLWDKTDIAPTNVLATATAPSGTQWHFATRSGNWWDPLDLGGFPAPRVMLASGSFWAGESMFFVNDVGVWQGPGGDRMWGLWPDGTAFGVGQPVFPTQIDTTNSQVDYGSEGLTGIMTDPLMDFDHPVVGVIFQSSNAAMSDGVYPPPFISSQPSSPGTGLVIVYNNIVQTRYTLTPPVLCDATTYYSEPLTQDLMGVPPVEVPIDATCFTNAAWYSYADTIPPPVPPTGAIGLVRATPGLIAVG